MKKENKKIAQQKRAEERKKQEQQRKFKQVLLIGIPVLVIAALIYIIAANPFTKKDTNAGSNQNDTTLTVENGDTVNIDYVGSIDGVEFAGGNTQGRGTNLTIGSGTYIDDFEEQLIGAHIGDTVDVYVTFPENYGKAELNGKEALFKVIINDIYK